MYLCVLCESQSKQRLFPYTALTGLFYNRGVVGLLRGTDWAFNRLTPNDPYMGRTAPLTSKSCILYIYSTNIGTEYFKHAIHSQVFLFKMQFVS